MVKICFLLVFVTTLLAAQPREGAWRGVLQLKPSEGIDLPFTFNVRWQGGVSLVIQNAKEHIEVNEVKMEGDSFLFRMPVFDTEFRCRLWNDTLLTGFWLNRSRKENNTIPFTARFGAGSRFEASRSKPGDFFHGKWEVTFSPNSADSSKAIGMFESGTNGYLQGTFRTETGDYRYLEGSSYGSRLQLSAFDGSHAFLFVADALPNGTLKGMFYAGNTWSEAWVARRNQGFELRDPEKLTYLKDPEEVIQFSFENLSSQTVSLTDKRYLDKVVIVQIMGSWCPNCMDETAYLSTLYNRFQGKGLEVIGLAYERTSDPEKARNNVRRLKARFGVNYEILVTGLTGKDQASTSLPFLNGIMAFPTTLILNKDHRVVSVYTGFNGPATGKAYEEYVYKTEKLLKSLLK